ncbi:GNAT family N-acetyltransferase [Pseudarthrobacter sp. GA104]|uniref:GNAT family N-acetyltransferase n=1 Tax=Pseudarthrobacter sp. GA104 TaxID=2676311 RepID=UPI00351A1B05
MLAVDPAVQGCGVGRAVVRGIMEHVRHLPGIETINMTSATLWNAPTPFVSRWASAGRRSGTGTCRAKTCC